MAEPIAQPASSPKASGVSTPVRARIDRRSVPISERVIEFGLFLAGASGVLVTVLIVGTLVYEAVGYFREVPILDFLTGTSWGPQFVPASHGVLPLIAGTLVTTLVALLVAVPVGTIVALWLSEYAPTKLRESVKPVLELLSAVPTVVFGYFALLFVIPILQTMFGWVGYELGGFNMLGAGLVMGIMIVPYVASLSEDAMRAVPKSLREGAYAMGATKFQTCVQVVFPAALSGITAAYILAVSRALGETMIVVVAAGGQPNFTMDPLQQAQTLTAYIASVAKGDLPVGSIGYRAIFAVGLTLLVMTLFFNVGGHWLRQRYKEAY
jgi:phosphate transport system permease protein